MVMIVGFLALACVDLIVGGFVMVFLLWFIVPACCLVWFALGFGVVDSWLVGLGAWVVALANFGVPGGLLVSCLCFDCGLAYWFLVVVGCMGSFFGVCDLVVGRLDCLGFGLL